MKVMTARNLIVASLSVSAVATVVAAGSGFLPVSPAASPGSASFEASPGIPSDAPGPVAIEAGDGTTFWAAQDARNVHSFYFTRGVYSGGGRSWAIDYPEADQWIVTVLNRLTGIDVYPREHPVRLDDPNLRRFPFLYILEVGRMNLREAEVEGLRDYLLAGGFLMVDDFWGTYEWLNFERQIRRVLPEYEIVELPLDHSIFSSFYQVDEIIQVPSIGNALRGQTQESDGAVPYCLGIFDDEGRLMVVINWNTDLGDAWEHAEHPYYPLKYSTYAYQMAANFIVYAMTR